MVGIAQLPRQRYRDRTEWSIPNRARGFGELDIPDVAVDGQMPSGRG